MNEPMNRTMPIYDIHDLAPHWDGPLPKPDIRVTGELKPMLADPGCLCEGEMYYMYRDVAGSDPDRIWLHEQGIRYDITVIPPRDLCGEYIKTVGHYHPQDPEGTGYPEIYEVMKGHANYLLQAHDLSQVLVFDAYAGDLVIVPPGYGHVTINPTKDTVLQMANLVSSRFKSDYREYVKRRGAAYYEMTSGVFLQNPLYPDVPPLQRMNALEFRRVSAELSVPLYSMVTHRRDVLSILNHPEKYTSIFKEIFGSGYST